MQNLEISHSPMGLIARVKRIFNADYRANKKQTAKEHRDYCRENEGLLGIALKRGRMHSFTPDDLPAFYRERERKTEQARREREEAERKKEDAIVGNEAVVLVGNEKWKAGVVSREG